MNLCKNWKSDGVAYSFVEGSVSVPPPHHFPLGLLGLETAVPPILAP